jgi:undecaprenyl-diphosphatase
LPTGGRTRLDEPLLDVRMVDADRGLARLRVALAALSGRLRRSAAYSSCVTDRVALAVEPGTSVAVDGEARRAPRRLALGPDERRLVVYCPARR